MAMRSIQSNVLSFGLVNIPVKLYSANDTSEKISFNQLHATKHTRLKQQMYDPDTGEVVPKEQIVKGYEHAKDQYVVFTPEELAAIEEDSDKRMEISEFVPAESVDPLYLDTIYFMGPDKGAERAFQLLLAALKDTKRSAVVTYKARGRENVALVRPLGTILALQNLRYTDEVRSPLEVPNAEAEVKPAEVALAKQLVEAQAAEAFDPSKYKNEHKERLKTIIDKKLKGEKIEAPAPKAATPAVGDLMAALTASINAKKPAPKGKGKKAG